MSTMTSPSQRFAQRLSSCASAASHASVTPGYPSADAAAPVAVHVVSATTDTAVVTGFGNDMAWLGGLGENVCVSNKQFTKRITTGRLDGFLT